MDTQTKNGIKLVGLRITTDSGLSIMLQVGNVILNCKTEKPLKKVTQRCVFLGVFFYTKGFTGWNWILLV